MPIYAYKCASCGHRKDVLQKLSDPVLTDCPACGEPGFAKQLTAAGFQLKGSGWYATDFKNAKPGAKPDDKKAADDKKSDDKRSDDQQSNDKRADDRKSADKPADAAAPAPAPAAAPAASSAGGDAAA